MGQAQAAVRGLAVAVVRGSTSPCPCGLYLTEKGDIGDVGEMGAAAAAWWELTSCVPVPAGIRYLF
jgi:hypothetical protein